MTRAGGNAKRANEILSDDRRGSFEHNAHLLAVGGLGHGGVPTGVYHAEANPLGRGGRT